MTAACREACCSVTPRFTVSELFSRGYRGSRAEPLPLQGETIRDAEGNAAAFSLAVENGRLVGLRFRATACATLIAYCQALAELLPGLEPSLAAHWTPQELVASVPGVHPLKQNRAVLAVAAVRAALQEAAISTATGAGTAADPMIREKGSSA